MNYSRVFLFVLALLVLNRAPAGSHHAFSPVYDAKKTITVDGVVTEFRFVNPHAMMLLEVKDKAGKVVTWNVEFAGRLNLEESGWTATSIKPGERVGRIALEQRPPAGQTPTQTQATAPTRTAAVQPATAPAGLDPDAEPPRIIGMYERGPTAVPVAWDARA